ncbi:MAG: hypothetical protein H6828_16355 [Planctomycetes bacterium]|nr:hypothetical protein [Planctomycetota bacterium]MCB9916696.1 hypothetical protein [Planctomycetota bacterium]
MAAPEPQPVEIASEKPSVPGLPAEILFLLVIGCLTVFFSLAGIPGTATPVAGDGSDALRQGWAEQRTAAVHDATSPAALEASLPRGR